MHHPVIAQILIGHLLVVVRAAIQAAAGELPAGGQDLGQRHIVQGARTGVGDRHFSSEILTLSQAGRVDGFVTGQEAYRQTQAFTHRRFVTRQRGAGLAEGDEQLAVAGVAHAQRLFVVPFPAAGIKRLAGHRRGGGDILPALFAFLPGEAITVIAPLTPRIAGHGHQGPGGGLGAVPTLPGQLVGNVPGQGPGFLLLVLRLGHGQADGLIAQGGTIGIAGAVILQIPHVQSGQFRRHSAEAHLLIGRRQQPAATVVAGTAAVVVLDHLQAFAQAVHGAHLGLAGQGQGVLTIRLGAPLPGAVAQVLAATHLVVGPVIQHACRHRIAQPFGFQQEVAGIGGAPVIGLGLAGPVTEAAIGQLESLEPFDAGADVGLDLLLLLLVQLHQLFQVQLWQHRRSGLFDTAVGVAQQVIQPPLQTHGRQSAHCKSGAVGTGHAVGLVIQRPGFAFLQHLEGIAGGGRVGRPHRQVHGFAGAMLAAAGGDRDGAGAHPVVGTQAQHGDLVRRAGEGQFRFAGFHAEQIIIRLHRQLDLFHRVIGHEHGHRQVHGFPGTHDPRQGAEQRQWLGHGDVLIRLAVGAIVTGHHHGPHLAHVGRQGDLVAGLVTRFQGEGAEEFHHWREAATLFFAAIIGAVGATQGQQPVQLGTVGTDHHVEQIPGQYAQGLTAIEGPVGVRGAVVGQAQQALVHQRQGIGHGLALFFADVHGELFFRLHFLRGVYLRLQSGGRVFHQ